MGIYRELPKYETWWSRIQMAWRIIRYGETMVGPELWYEPVHKLIHCDTYTHVEHAVAVVDQNLSRSSPIWLDEVKKNAYANLTTGGRSCNIQKPVWNFMIAWAVMKKEGKIP